VTTHPAPLRVQTCPHRRALPEVKHLGLTPELAVRRAARLAGYDDALLAEDGRVTEGPTWALVLVLDGRAVAPVGGLPSTTVALLARAGGVEHRPVTVDEARRAEAALALNAGWGVREVAAIDGTTLPGSPLAAALGAAYDAVAREPFA